MVRRKSEEESNKKSNKQSEKMSFQEERDTIDTSISDVSSVSDSESEQEENPVIVNQKSAKQPAKIPTTAAAVAPQKDKPVSRTEAGRAAAATTSANAARKGRKSVVPPKKFIKISRAMEEIRRLQSTTQNLIPRAPFLRLVKETIQNRTGNQGFKVTETAVEALREASENLLTNIFEDSYLLSMHAKRVTLMPRDMQLLMRLKHSNFFSIDD